jgi:hypothetical protein
MVMPPHALIPSATPFGLGNVKLLRRNRDANALFAHFGEGDLLRAVRHLDQSTSAARCIAGLFGFLILIQCFDLPCAMERRRLRRVGDEVRDRRRRFARNATSGRQRLAQKAIAVRPNAPEGAWTFSLTLGYYRRGRRFADRVTQQLE